MVPLRILEEPVFDGQVGLGLLDREVRRSGRALFALVNGGGNPNAGNLAICSQVRLGDLFAPADVTFCDDADLEKAVRIEEEVVHVAVLERDAQLVGGRAVDVLDAEVLDPAAFLAPGDQATFEVGVLGQRARIVLRGPLRLAAAAKWSELPALLAVPGLDRRQTLPGHFGADFARALLHLRPNRLEFRAAAAGARENGAPGEADRLKPLHVGATSGGEVLRQQLVEGNGVGRTADGEQRKQRDPHATSAKES
jgi:hypothetical protein